MASPQGYAAAPMAGVATPQFAGWWRRFGAYLIDGIILGVVYFILNFAVNAAMPGPATPTADQLQDSTVATTYLTAAAAHATTVLSIVLPIIVVIGTAYFAWSWSSSGQTLGQKALGIKVVRENGQLLGIGGGILRYIVGMGILNNIVFGLPIGWLWPLWDSKKQGWHDKIAGTIVVRS